MRRKNPQTGVWLRTWGIPSVCVECPGWIFWHHQHLLPVQYADWKGSIREFVSPMTCHFTIISIVFITREVRATGLKSLSSLVVLFFGMGMRCVSTSVELYSCRRIFGRQSGTPNCSAQYLRTWPLMLSRPGELVSVVLLRALLKVSAQLLGWSVVLSSSSWVEARSFSLSRIWCSRSWGRWAATVHLNGISAGGGDVHSSHRSPVPRFPCVNFSSTLFLYFSLAALMARLTSLLTSFFSDSEPVKKISVYGGSCE